MSQYQRDFDRQSREFDRRFKRTERLVAVAWVFGALLSVAFLALVGWGIYTLVTSK